jgi:hypothetical protein
MTVNVDDYWEECIAQAAEECGLALTKDQLTCLASAANDGHEHYGMAFYSPSWNERISDIEADYKAKITLLQAKYDRYTEHAELAIKQALRVHRDERVTIGEHGNVLLHTGHTYQIQ